MRNSKLMIFVTIATLLVAFGSYYSHEVRDERRAERTETIINDAVEKEIDESGL